MPFPLLSLAGGRDAVDARNSLPTSGMGTWRITGMSTGRAGFQPANNNKNNISNMNDEVRVYQNSISKFDIKIRYQNSISKFGIKIRYQNSVSKFETIRESLSGVTVVPSFRRRG